MTTPCNATGLRDEVFESDEPQMAAARRGRPGPAETVELGCSEPIKRSRHSQDNERDLKSARVTPNLFGCQAQPF